MPLYCDCPLTKVWGIPERSEELPDGCVRIFPGGCALGTVQIPEEMIGQNLDSLTRSRWARIGKNVKLCSNLSEKGFLGVTIENCAQTHSLIVRPGNTVVVALMEEIKSSPLVERVPLTAAPTLLKMNTHGLPKSIVWKESARLGCIVSPSPTAIPYIDPHNTDFTRHLIESPYTTVDLRRDEYLVVWTREEPTTPEGHIGIIEPAVDGLAYNTAKLDNPGSRGRRLIEVRATQRTRIAEGMLLAYLDIYAVPDAPAYNGPLGTDGSFAAFSRGTW